MSLLLAFQGAGGPGTQTLTPSLFDESVDTFFAPKVNLKIFPGLYTDPDTFFAPKINLVLKPSLYTDADTFFTPKVSHRLRPNLYTDADTFFTPKINLVLKPNLYTDADAFFTPKVSHGLHAGLYTDADTFYTPVVSQPGAGSQTLLPSLYVDSDTFFTPVVLPRTTLTPSIYTDVDTFFGAVVKGRNTLTPNLFIDPESYFTQVISQGPGGDQNLSPPMFRSFLNTVFFTSEVTGGDQVPPEEEIFQGGGKQYRYEKINNSSDIDRIMHCGDVLTIRYKDGKVYNYCDVPEKKFDRIANSRSPGSYVHNNIKEKYSYRKVK